jgi:hypothetical protein
MTAQEDRKMTVQVDRKMTEQEDRKMEARVQENGSIRGRKIQQIEDIQKILK